MDWLLATQQINSAFSSLGSLEGDTYVVNPNALAILEEINYKLTYEDQTLRTFRRAIGFCQNVRSDLIPLLENVKDDDVLDSVIRILVNLTVPVECLFSVDVMYRTEVGRHTIFELNKLLYASKEAFTDPKSTKSVVEYMKHILESDSKLSPHKCDQINNCLLLLRNILHIPDTNTNFIMPTVHAQSNGTHAVSMQNAILWNLFIQSIDKLLLYLMTCPQRAFWGFTMVQLIALMYKDQHVSTLQKLLNMWFEASLSESSEDNESNTSPPKQGSGDSSPMLTSDPTSDSSDNGSGTGCKNESSEDRRQALREETEATLQEVSRKGQEYQDLMLREPAEIKHEVAENAADLGDERDGQESYSDFFIKVEAMETLDEEDEETASLDGTVNTTKTEHEDEDDIISTTTKQQQQQPAEHATSTSTINKPHRLNADDAATFMPPPAPPAVSKSLSLADLDSDLDADLPPKQWQKMPHSGQLNLTKGKCGPQKRECPSSQSELSDCGYATQVENIEFISTSSNDDDGPQNKPQHQKPPCSSKSRNKQRAVLTVIDKKELRRKKLVKRSKSSLINMKGLVQHIPTDDDISNLLKEFTVDFLLKGYGNLVEELHSQLLTNMKIPIDTSHFFWLVTYFLKFAAQLELDMEHINTILTYDVISYLTYEGVTLCEQLELNSRQEGCDLKPYLRRMHLVVTAIREFLQAIETYKKVTHLSGEDREHLRRLQIQISTTEDLRCLFVLLLRRFNPSLHTKQYLQDLVVTNHILLLILDSVTQSEDNVSIKMIDHISQFANLEVMHYYGILLEDFNNNGEFVNDCIFTMMHHIGGDLDQISCLFQPVILKTYSRIWEADYELSDDWSDLIEFVIHKFMNAPQKSPLTLPSASLTELTKEHNLENTVSSWTQEEMDTLYWYYVQSKKNNDIVGKIVKLFSNNGNKQKSRISIIQQLLQQDIITLVEYDDLMKFEDAEYQRTLLTTPTSNSTESGIELKDSAALCKPSDDIQILRDLIIKENKEKHLTWLQKALLECCYIKLILKKRTLREECQNLEYIMEPVAYHCILKNKSIPVVQWNNEQASTMLYQPFVLLLHKLGFQLPADAGSVFARIPDFWTADIMFSLAKKLGPLDKLLIKFDVSQFEDLSVEAGPSRCHHIARASLSSSSSLEVETTDDMRYEREPSELTPVPELDVKFEKTNVHEIFAVPNAKHCNSIIRFTPDPMSTPSVPNWLQLVMRSKCSSAASTTATGATVTTTTAVGATPTTPTEKNEADICMTSNMALSTLMTTTTTTSSHIMATPRMASAVATATTTHHNHHHHHLQQQHPYHHHQHQQQQQQQHSHHPHHHQAHHQPTTALPCPSINNIIGTHNEQLRGSINSGSRNFSNNNSNANANANNSITSSSNSNKNHHHHHHNNIATTLSAAAAAVAILKEQQQMLLMQQQLQHQQQQQQQQSQQQQSSQNISDDSDSAMKSLERNDSSSSGYYTRSGSGNLDSEYCAMVASVYETEIANSDCASVASDLTRMYVSDEDERHEIRGTNFF